MDREVWQATAHKITKSQTRLKRLSTHARRIFSVKGQHVLNPVTLFPCMSPKLSITKSIHYNFLMYFTHKKVP